MKQSLLLAICVSLICSAPMLHAQAGVDKLLDEAVSIKTIGSARNNLVDPTDLDFNRDEGRENELWVLNQGGNLGGSTVTFYNPGQNDQTSLYLVDGNNWHFMAQCAALAFGDSETWGTAQNIVDANRQAGVFAGPSLWSTDLDIYAVDHGRNGSHLDMLHITPNSSGIAAETGNIFWLFDGLRGNIVRTDFKEPHEPGGEFHGDALVRRYTEISVAHNGDIPCHMDIDDDKKWLYIVDGGNRRILRADITTGAVAGNLQLVNEQLAEYSEVTGVTWEVYIDSGFEVPCGIDYKDGRLIVGDNATGEIIFYDVTGESPVEMGRVSTGAYSLMGIVIGPDDNVYFVDQDRSEVCQLAPSGAFDVTVERPVLVAQPGEQEFEFTVENLSEAEITFEATMLPTGRTPSQWQAEATAGAVGPGESKTFKMSVAAGLVPGIGDYQLVVDAPGQAAVTSKSKLLTVVAQNTDLMSVNDAYSPNRNDQSIGTVLTALLRATTIEVPASIAEDLIGRLPQLKTIVWTAGGFGKVSPEEAAVLEDAMDAGVNVMLIGDGPVVGIGAGGVDGNVGPAFLDNFGAAYGGLIVSGFGTNGAIRLEGITGDPISGSVGVFSGRLTLFNGGGFITAIPSPLLRAADDDARPFIYYEDHSDSTLAVRYINEKYRSIILSINPSNFDSRSIRNTILSESVRWLENREAQGTPAIQVSTEEIDFGQVPVGARRTRPVVISNTGDGTLDILGLSFTSAAASFELNEEVTVPMFIAPNESVELEITFRPQNGDPVVSELIIASNGGDDVAVKLYGNVVSSVTPLEGRSAQLSLEVGPNPVQAEALVSYELQGQSKHVTIDLVDATGRTVAQLLDGTVESGAHQLRFDASSLAGGLYFLVMNADGETVFARMPLVK